MSMSYHSLRLNLGNAFVHILQDNPFGSVN
jgi:hypothetical protein